MSSHLFVLPLENKIYTMKYSLSGIRENVFAISRYIINSLRKEGKYSEIKNYKARMYEGDFKKFLLVSNDVIRQLNA